LPDDAIILDAAGRFVIPGLSNIHQHPPLRHIAGMYAPIAGPDVDGDDLTLPYDLLMFLYLAAGITRIEVMAGTPEDLGLRAAIRAGRYRGPSMRIASPVIDGPPAMWSTAITWLANDAAGGRKAAQLIAERGYDFAKPYSVLGREAYIALAAECRALNIPMMGHIPRSVTPDEAFAFGQAGVAHAFEYFYNESGADRFRPEVIARRVKTSAELGVTVQSTFVAARAFEYDCGRLAAGEFSMAETLDPLLRKIMQEDSPFIQNWRSDPHLMEAGRDVIAHCTALSRALVEAGVPLLPGTDSSVADVSGQNSIHYELQLLVEWAGMTPLQALRAATVQCAEYQGEGAVAGAVQPGHRSDLVVIDRDPTHDITATREIHAVLVGDALLRRSGIDTGLARAKARYDAMPVSA
jgi:imidazolonepropionase-like amidohydrolase